MLKPHTFSLLPSICSSSCPSTSLALNSGTYCSMLSPFSHWQTCWVVHDNSGEDGSSKVWKGALWQRKGWRGEEERGGLGSWRGLCQWRGRGGNINHVCLKSRVYSHASSSMRWLTVCVHALPHLRTGTGSGRGGSIWRRSQQEKRWRRMCEEEKIPHWGRTPADGDMIQIKALWRKAGWWATPLKNVSSEALDWTDYKAEVLMDAPSCCFIK